ncbi:MAG: protein tyrosine/serine phosphatase [Acidobacteria bacterium]|nr:protein tyrosine/serine phosphatase [Acidobacteriota bacterium]
MSSRRSLAVIALVVLAACRTASGPDGLPPNFGVVEEGKIYRGAQPDAANLEALQRRGIRTIVKLNGSDPAEEAAATRLGMQIVSVPLDARTVGNAQSCDDVERAYQAITNPSNWPVYVHCTHGRDRTGYLVGLYRERAERWAYPRVEQELEQYGHGSFWRRLLPNISHALAGGPPVCTH